MQSNQTRETFSKAGSSGYLVIFSYHPDFFGGRIPVARAVRDADGEAYIEKITDYDPLTGQISFEETSVKGDGLKTTYVWERGLDNPVEVRTTDKDGNLWVVKFNSNRNGTEAVATWLKNGSPVAPSEAKRHFTAYE